MLTAPPRITFSEHALEVRDMVDDGLSLAQVECALADCDLAEDSKAALWLLAWSDLVGDRSHAGHGPLLARAPFTCSGPRVLPFRRG